MALERSQALEMGVLLLATLYAFTIPLKGSLTLVDTAILVALFLAYTWAASRVPSEEPELVGSAEVIGELPTAGRRLVTAALSLFAGYVIFISAEPFAEGLIGAGKSLGVDEFFLVQWLAPLASESPEFIIAILFVWRGHAAAGMRRLVSSKVNQWTLLVATLPAVFSFGAGTPTSMPLVGRQEVELWLTAAQSLFALMLIAEFSMNRWEALALLIPFLLQLFLPSHIGGVDVHWAFTISYGAAAVLLLLDPERRAAIACWPRYVRESVFGSPVERREMGSRPPPPTRAWCDDGRGRRPAAG